MAQGPDFSDLERDMSNRKSIHAKVALVHKVDIADAFRIEITSKFLLRKDLILLTV